MNLLNHQILLASRSQVRQQILVKHGFKVRTMPADLPEKWQTKDSAAANVERLAIEKAMAIVSPPVKGDLGGLFLEEVIIAADTIGLDAQGKLLLKPQNRKQAETMMQARSGQTEQVITGYCVIFQGKKVSGFASSKIEFKVIPQEVIADILDTENYQAAAGALRIEGKIKPYVKSYSGDYYTILGLPLQRIVDILRRWQP